MATTIYVNTDNSDATSKLYDARKIGKSADAAEKRMQQAVIDVLKDKKLDFNTDTPGKGYSLRMKVLTERIGQGTKYTVTIEIVRYPLETGKGGKGEISVPISARPGEAIVEGSSEANVLDAIEQLTKSNVKASLGVMKIDMTRR